MAIAGVETSTRHHGPDGGTLLDVIIVTVDGARELLRDCLTSLRRHPPTAGPSVVWLVDNATRDGTASMVQAEFPGVRLITLAREVGFSAGNNVALRRATSPFALLLNPDTEVSEGALDHAIEALRERPDAGVLGVRLVRRDGSFDHAAKRQFPTMVGALGHFTGVGRRTAGGALAQYRAPGVDELGCGEVDAVNGAFMLLRREAFAAVGLLDERYRMYGEDLDWCYRFKRAGWRVLYDGRATVVHVKGGTTILEARRGRHRALATNVMFHRAIGRFYRKFHAGEHPVVDLAVYGALGVKLVISVSRSAVARRGLR
ncbi:MAG TPA: glycosyltransferase family 2 protein [Solirubrobacteraceae bacterium]|nr:glycosyltransferase family 2 protein [Solirubrobacteraceae bacterium]